MLFRSTDTQVGDHVGFHKVLLGRNAPDRLPAPYLDGLESPADGSNIVRGLIARGYADEDIRKVAGRNALEILVFTNIASIDAIANATGITPEKLSEIWNDLPLNDKAIASTLGQTRQQIINLRKSARERLARRIEWRRRP